MTEVLTYEALKAERDALADRVNALAVENAAMRNAIDFATAEDMWIEQHDGMFDYRYQEWYVDVLNEAKETPATDAALAAIHAQAKAEAIDELAIKLERLADDELDVLSDAAEFETYQEEHHTFVSISNPRAVANAVLSLVKELSTELREAK